MVRAVATAGARPARILEDAEAFRSEVFDGLRPYSRQFASFEPEDLGRTIPADTRRDLASRLEDVSILQHHAIAAIDQAFGQGTWMSEAVTQKRGFIDEARRVLLDPQLGPESADQAIALLRSNNFSYGEASRALRDGNVAKLVDMRNADDIEHATAEAFAKSERWR